MVIFLKEFSEVSAMFKKDDGMDESLKYCSYRTATMANPGPGFWVLSQALLLVFFKMDNGSNVCGIEFNFNNTGKNKTVSRNIDSAERKSHDSANLLDAEVFFGAKIPHQLEVVSEEGRYGSIILSCQCSIFIC